jgi:LysR family nitrogen assimilation transcriptional regulator
MDLQQLRTFAAIVDAGGVGRAAERLNLSQPAVSRQILGLETDLGVTLFDRLGARMRLTSQGEDLLRRCRDILAEAEALRERALALRQGDTGLVRLGATPPMIESILVPFLPDHRRRHPAVEVRIVEDGGSALESRLERGDVHVAYIPASSERFAGRLLFPIHVIAVVSKDSPLARHKTLEIADLAKEPLLVLRRGFGSREWFDTACAVADMRPSILLESSSHNAVLGLVSSGYGIGILPSAVTVRAQDCRAIPLVNRGEPIGKWTMLAWDSRRYLPPYAETLVDELVAHARAAYPGWRLVRRAPAIRQPSIAAD